MTVASGDDDDDNNNNDNLEAKYNHGHCLKKPQSKPVINISVDIIFYNI
jgi:hypothetical protein